MDAQGSRGAQALGVLDAVAWGPTRAVATLRGPAFPDHLPAHDLASRCSPGAAPIFSPSSPALGLSCLPPQAEPSDSERVLCCQPGNRTHN